MTTSNFNGKQLRHDKLKNPPHDDDTCIFVHIVINVISFVHTLLATFFLLSFDHTHIHTRSF
eukprot:m.48845 g.48845  ORF g.48845 m.48845 type:complete len:62 (-) comp12429_c0_seq2:1551-1736(-)